MAIKKIRLSHLRNEAHYELFAVFHSLLDRFPAVKQLVNSLYATFAELLDREKQFVDAAKESLLTAKLVEADRRVDRDVSAMRHIIRAAKNHFDPATVEAARQLFGRLKDFGYVCTKSYEEESAAVQVLVGDLQTAFAPQAQAVGLTPSSCRICNSAA